MQQSVLMRGTLSCTRLTCLSPRGWGGVQVSSVPLQTNVSKPNVNGIDCDEQSAAFKRTGRCPAGSVVQLGGRPHSAYPTPDNRCVLSPNIAEDRIYSLRFDPHTGGLSYTNGSFAQSPQGTGPRHLAFSPADPRVVFVLNEPSCTITTWHLDAEGGCGLTEAGANHSTLRPVDNHSLWHAAEIRAAGKFLYTSNRLNCNPAQLAAGCNGTIATFRIGPAGSLELIGHIDSGGHSPRVFDIDPTGRWLVVGNGGIESPMYGGSGGYRNVRVLKIDPSTGMPAGEASSTWELAWDAPPASGSVPPPVGRGSPAGIAFALR